MIRRPSLLPRQPPLRLAARALRAKAWALADHSLASASNFFLFLAVARSISASEFGQFVLAYSALLVAYGLQWALIIQPHNVLGATKLGGRAYAVYTATTGAAQVTYALTLGLGTLVVAIVAHVEGWDVASLLVPLALAIPAWQIQEFGRRVLYTERRTRAAFATDLVSYGGQLVGLAVLWSLDELNGSRALYVVAATSVLGALVGTFLIRTSLERRISTSALRENWRFGRWLAVAFTASGFSTHFFLYVVAALGGAALAGGLRASQVILGPLHVVFLFLLGVLPIDFASAAEGGRPGRDLRSTVRLAFVVTAPAVAAYCLVVTVAADPLLRAIFGPEYAPYAWPLRILALYYLIFYVTLVLYAALSGLRMTKSIAIANAAAAVVTLVVGIPLTLSFDAAGAAASMVAGILALALLYARRYRDARPPDASSPIAGEAPPVALR